MSTEITLSKATRYCVRDKPATKGQKQIKAYDTRQETHCNTYFTVTHFYSMLIYSEKYG
jgi:hypothetical protein